MKEGLMPATANNRFTLMLHVSSSLSQLIPAAGVPIRIRQGLVLTAVKRHLSNTGTNRNHYVLRATKPKRPLCVHC